MVQLSQLYMATGKTIALTTWTFVRKVMSLLFNMLSRFVKAFLPRNKHLLISTSDSNCCFLTCIQVSQETGKVVWYSHLRIVQFVVIHTVKGFSIVNEADAFLELPLLSL